MSEINTYCKGCEKDHTIDEIQYEIRLGEIHGGDYEYGYSPGCTIIIEWSCKEGYVMSQEKVEL